MKHKICTPQDPLSWRENKIQARMMAYTHIKFRYIDFEIEDYNLCEFLFPLSHDTRGEFFYVRENTSRWMAYEEAPAPQVRRACAKCWAPLDKNLIDTVYTTCIKC